MIPIMSIETAATASEQIPGNSSRTATTADLPQNSDVVLILSQTAAAMEAFEGWSSA
jgi:hypothetical protein